MAKLLVVEGSGIVRGVFKDLLGKHTDFDFDLVATYTEAKELLESNSYEFAVVERNLEASIQEGVNRLAGRRKGPIFG